MATDFKGYLIEEFIEDYEEGSIQRREALKLIAGVVGSLLSPIRFSQHVLQRLPMAFRWLPRPLWEAMIRPPRRADLWLRAKT